ncbi:helix-turn-helix transcriptional regulator [Tissierella sp.]|uniref:helix-turn-helix transcriptional regulator n=1 Tax=Tissierella sp. TaxID=41274 RepID=UPI003055BD85
MNIKHRIKVLCAHAGISMAELARRIDHSPQNFNAKLKRESFTIKDYFRIAEAVGCKFEYSFVFDKGIKLTSEETL